MSRGVESSAIQCDDEMPQTNPQKSCQVIEISGRDVSHSACHAILMLGQSASNPYDRPGSFRKGQTNPQAFVIWPAKGLRQMPMRTWYTGKLGPRPWRISLREKCNPLFISHVMSTGPIVVGYNRTC
jgi:hypothetical protein